MIFTIAFIVSCNSTRDLNCGLSKPEKHYKKKDWKKDVGGCITKKRTGCFVKYMINKHDPGNKKTKKYIIRKFGKPDAFFEENDKQTETIHYYFDVNCEKEGRYGVVIITFSGKYSTDCIRMYVGGG